MTEHLLGGRLILRRDAVTSGWSDGELARQTRAGGLYRVRRGAYVGGELPDRAVDRHRLLIQATLGGLRLPGVVSHQSAAVLLGMPLWGVRLDRVHITRRPRAWNDSSGVLRCHVARMRDDEVVLLDGIEVTNPVRTALDLARSLPHEAAVVVLDAALHEKLISAEQLALRLPDILGTPRSRSAARSIAFADERSGSVGESRSRIVLAGLGLAPSALQFVVQTPDGGFVARTDFAWEEARLIGEFDGRVKYGRLLRPGQHPGDAVFEEKRREDAIRDEGWGVVRWTWSDIPRPDRMGSRVRRALERAAARAG
jgi:very-short-patch-repair endonuclease